MLRSALAPDASVGLYVHLPWCVRKCPYCDFNSHPLKGALPEDAYLRALLADLASERESGRCDNIKTVYFGGGTPSLFSPDSFRAILEALPGTPAEVTLEVNPGTVEHGDFDASRRAGITRVSLGAQSFNATQLRLLGRIHSAEETRAAAARVAGAGFDSFNIDLMYGLPHQSVADALADLEQAVRLEPQHVSWYQLTIEAKTEFARRPPTGLPTPDLAADIEEAGWELLARHGYRRYEVSAFARDGLTCAHNVNYWRFGDYVGIGAGAHGKATADGAIRRITKPHQPRLYLGDAKSSATPVPREDLPTEFMMNALRLADGVERPLFAARTGLPLANIAQSLDELADWGLMRKDRIALTPHGYRHLDTVVARFQQTKGVKQQ